MSSRDSGYGGFDRHMPDRPRHGRHRGSSGAEELTADTALTQRRRRDEEAERERQFQERENERRYHDRRRQERENERYPQGRERRRYPQEPESRGIESPESLERDKFRAKSDEMGFRVEADDEEIPHTGRQRSVRAFSDTSAQKENSLVNAPVCLDAAHRQSIHDWAQRRTYGIGIFADQPTLFEVDDYRFLLEAVQCELAADRHACIRLYLLVRKYSTLPNAQACQRFLSQLEREDERNQDERKVEAIETIVQHMSRTRAVGMPPGDSLSVSRLTSTTPLPLQTHDQRRARHAEDAKLSSLAVGFHTKPSAWFSIGRVFIMLWHENDTSGNMAPREGGVVTQGRYREKVHSEIRRFAVVREGHGFSWAIPVNTYQGQGLNRPGLYKQDHDAHAIIYMDDTTPQRLLNEPPMNKRPIAVVGGSYDKKLHAASRIRFDKVFSIEHNVKVKNVGKVSQKSMPWFCGYWREEARAADAAAANAAAAAAVAPGPGGRA